MNKAWNFLTSYKKIFLVSLVATCLFAIYQFYPAINGLIGWGMMVTIGQVVPNSMIFGTIAPWVVAGMLCAIISLLYYLASIRNAAAAACLGFAVSYFLVSILSVFVVLNVYVEISIGIILAYGVFAFSCWMASRLTVNHVLLIVGGVIVLGLSLVLTPAVTNPIVAQQFVSKDNNDFKQGVESLQFTPYYPSYASSVYAASVAKLNGYSNDAYSNETVTFSLGRAYVKQSALLQGQGEIMDFVKNCDISSIWYAMEQGSVKEQEIKRSQDNPQKCTIVHTTPEGKKVYFKTDGQWTKFYIQLNQTNLIIEFDDLNRRKYDPAQQGELFKVIDSLQPLDKVKLENGNKYGYGSSY